MKPRVTDLQLQGRPALQPSLCSMPAERDWLMHFGPWRPAGAGLQDGTTSEPGHSANVHALQIAGAAATRIRSVQIRLGRETRVQIDSVPDGRAGLISAGELIEAMAIEFGWQGMTLDLACLELDANLMQVSVLIAAADPETAAKLCITMVA